MTEEEYTYKYKLRKFMNSYGWDINSDDIKELVEKDKELREKFELPQISRDAKQFISILKEIAFEKKK